MMTGLLLTHRTVLIMLEIIFNRKYGMDVGIGEHIDIYTLGLFEVGIVRVLLGGRVDGCTYCALFWDEGVLGTEGAEKKWELEWE